VRLSNADRLAFVWLYGLCPSVVDAARLSDGEGDPLTSPGDGSPDPRVVVQRSREIRDLIREMSRGNWLWSALGSMANYSSWAWRSLNRLSPSTQSNADNRVSKAERLSCATMQRELTRMG